MVVAAIITMLQYAIYLRLQETKGDFVVKLLSSSRDDGTWACSEPKTMEVAGDVVCY